jgi:hypothetical protein
MFWPWAEAHNYFFGGDRKMTNSISHWGIQDMGDAESVREGATVEREPLPSPANFDDLANRIERLRVYEKKRFFSDKTFTLNVINDLLALHKQAVEALGIAVPYIAGSYEQSLRIPRYKNDYEIATEALAASESIKHLLGE